MSGEQAGTGPAGIDQDEPASRRAALDWPNPAPMLHAGAHFGRALWDIGKGVVVARFSGCTYTVETKR